MIKLERIPPIVMPLLLPFWIIACVFYMIAFLFGFWSCDKCKKWFWVGKEQKQWFGAVHGFMCYEEYEKYCSKCADIERGIKT